MKLLRLLPFLPKSPSRGIESLFRDRGSNLNYSLNGRGASFLTGEGVVSELTFGIDHNEPKVVDGRGTPSNNSIDTKGIGR